MDWCAIWQKQLNSLEERSENFYIQSLRTLSSHKHYVTSQEWVQKRNLVYAFSIC